MFCIRESGIQEENMTLNTWSFWLLIIIIFAAIFTVGLIIEIRTSLDKTNKSLEEIKQTLEEIKNKKS